MNYYKVLGVSENASDKEIKKSYKQLVKRFHPDVFEGNKDLAEKKIKELNEAYEVLSDTESRKKYDDSLHQVDIETIKNDLQNYAQESYEKYDSTSSYSSAKRYEDLYRNNYYKKYTTNYYGVSRDDLNDEKTNIHKKSKPASDKDFFGGSRSRFLIIIAFSFLFLAIALIILLSLLRNFISSSSFIFSSGSVPEESQYQNNSLPYVTFGMHFYDIRDAIGSPDFVETRKKGTYAYWGTSYIVFDRNDYVIDWKNTGDYFSTDAATGKEARVWLEVYNYVMEQDDDSIDF